MKTICIHQPDFAPYIGFFDRLLNSDHFVILDNVQFIRRGWHHRDKIKSPKGASWLSLSVQKGNYQQIISDVKLVDEKRWREKNLALLKDCYANAPFFDMIYPEIESICRAKHRRLIDFNLAFLEMSFRILGIKIKTTLSSKYLISSSRSRRLLDLVLAVDGKSYLTGLGSRQYLDESLFIENGIEVIWQEFKHPVYPQLYGNFEPMLSCLDLFFNCGTDSLSMIRGQLID